MVNDYFETYSSINKNHYGAEIDYYSNENLRESEIKILNKIPVSEMLLDAACGAGRFSLNVAKLGYKVLGVDFTEESIQRASEVAKKQNLKSATFKVGDVTNLPIVDDSFNYTFCIRYSLNSIPTYEKRRMAVQELLRVTKRGGKVFIETQNMFNIKRGLLNPLRNIIVYFYRIVNIQGHKVLKVAYNGLLPGDIVYKSSKIKDAPDGFTHIPSYWEIESWVPKKYKFRIYSEKEILYPNKRDFLKLLSYSLWTIIEK